MQSHLKMKLWTKIVSQFDVFENLWNTKIALRPLDVHNYPLLDKWCSWYLSAKRQIGGNIPEIRDHKPDKIVHALNLQRFAQL